MSYSDYNIREIVLLENAKSYGVLPFINQLYQLDLFSDSKLTFPSCKTELKSIKLFWSQIFSSYILVV